MKKNKQVIHTHLNMEDLTDFVNELKLFIALILEGNEFHIRGPLCLSVFKRLAVLIDEI